MTAAPVEAMSPVRRILVFANETLENHGLLEQLNERARDERLELLVVAPALNTRLHHWVSDVDRSNRAAEARLTRTLARLAEGGIQADGRVGDADPMQAIADALMVFPADEVVISTQPETRSNWLARGVVSRARAVFPIPIVHVMADAPVVGRV